MNFLQTEHFADAGRVLQAEEGGIVPSSVFHAKTPNNI